MKRILLCAVIFIAVFVIAFLMMFPLDEIVKKQLDAQIAANNLPVSYSTVEAGIFSTKISGLTVNNIDAGMLTVKYTPLSLLTKSASATLISPMGNAQLNTKKNVVSANIDADLDLIGRIIGQNMLGFVNLNAEYDLSTRKGSYRLNGGPLEMQLSLPALGGGALPVKFENVTGEGIIEDNNLFVSAFQATGPISASANGRITIDTRNILRSQLALNVDASLFGGNSRSTIRGTLMSPQLVMQ